MLVLKIDNCVVRARTRFLPPYPKISTEVCSDRILPSLELMNAIIQVVSYSFPAIRFFDSIFKVF